ncbi:MAG: cell wall hydrolase [Xanthobacteraceae bacterium]
MQVSSLRFSVGLGSLLAVLILGSVYAAFIPPGDDNALNDELPPRDIIGETQLHCVALAVYFEGGSTSESEEGQRHIARVVVERAKANLRKWGGSDLCDVVFYKKAGVCQFTFACLPLARRTPRPGKAWDQALAYATDELEGRSSIVEDSIRYYMNPALTSDRNACRFKKEFVPVLVAGRHHFFREADSFERADLRNGNPIECQRYQAALEAKKRIAKAKAERLKRLALLKKKKKQLAAQQAAKVQVASSK